MMEKIIPRVKDKAILTGWILGLLLFICLLWVLTQPLQSRYLLRSVNKVLSATGDSRVLRAPLIKNMVKPPLFGYWYSMVNTTDKFFVFAFFQDGILVPFGATVSSDGKVEEITPLGAHARKKAESINENVMRLYTLRIENASLQLQGEL